MTTMSTTTYKTPARTPHTAAKRIRQYLIERHAMQDEPEVNLPVVWDRAKSREWGAGDCWSVVLESSEAYEWAIETDRIREACNIDRTKVFIEPYSTYLLCIYPEG